MTQRKSFSNLDQLRLRHAEVSLNLLHYRWKRLWTGRNCVVVEGETLESIYQEGDTLVADQLKGSIFFSAESRLALLAEESNLTGRHPGGRIQAQGGKIDLASPPNYYEGWSGMSQGLWQSVKDLLGIAALSLPMLAVTTVAGQIIGAPPETYSDIDNVYVQTALLAAAGTYVGVAGRHTGSFVRATILAAVIIFGPEILQGARQGLPWLIRHLGWEDICKTLWYGFTWTVGSLGRSYFQQRTRSY